MESFRFRFHIRDLIVLTLVVALLLGIFLPWVNAAREAGRRLQCSNNLKQLGLGVHNYADVYRGALPYGTWQNRKLAPQWRLSWTVSLTSYIEQIFFLFDYAEPWNTGGNLPPKIRYRNDDGRTWVDVPAPIHSAFVCPSKTLPQIRGLSATAYVGPAGLGQDAAAREWGDPNNGIWGYDRQTKLSDITDGPSQTILFLETARNNGAWTAGGEATVRSVAEEGAQLGNGRPFGGFHPRGCQAAHADGSVRFIDADIDSQAFARYFTISEESVPSRSATKHGQSP